MAKPTEEEITEEARRLHAEECGCNDLPVDTHSGWREYARLTLMGRRDRDSPPPS